MKTAFTAACLAFVADAYVFENNHSTTESADGQDQLDTRTQQVAMPPTNNSKVMSSINFFYGQKTTPRKG